MALTQTLTVVREHLTGLKWFLKRCLWAGLSGLGACASQMDIRTLATGQADRSAYELNGSKLDALRREAQRLCPVGADVLRQVVAGQKPEVMGGRLQRWWQVANDAVDPPQTQAQLVVVCHAEAAGLATTLAPLPAPVVTAVVKPVDRPEPVAAAPIGPLMPEW